MTDLVIDLAITDDGFIEGAEDFSLGLTNATSTSGIVTAVGTDASVTTTINDDTDGVGAGEDGPATWNLSGSTETNEGDSAGYVVSLTGTYQAGESISVDLGVADNQTTPADYSDFATAVNDAVTAYNADPANAGTLTFDGTALTFTASLDDDSMSPLNITLPITDDGLNEPQETFDITLTNPTSSTGITTSVGTGSVTTTITGPPVAENDINVTNEGTPVSGNVVDNDSDPDGDPLNVTSINGTAVSGPTTITTVGGGMLTINPNGSYDYTPADGFTGEDTVVYEVTDANGNTVEAELSIEVRDGATGENTPPIAGDDSFEVVTNQPLTAGLFGNDGDPDGDPIAVVDPATGDSATSPVTIPTTAGGTVTIDPDGTFTYTPPTGYVGPDSFDYSIVDPSGATDSATVELNVQPDPTPGENDPPNAGDDATIGQKNDPVSGDLLENDTDPNGDPLTINTTPIEGPTNGTLVINPNGTYTYTPNNDFVGNDSFTYEVCDEDGICDTATVHITIFDNAPKAADNLTNTLVDTPVTGNVLTNDSDPNTGDELTVNTTPLNGPTNGTLTLNENGTYEYTPNPGFVGFDSFEYEVCDEGGNCDTALVTIEVRSTAGAPTPQDDNFTTFTDSPVSGNVLLNDTDPNADPLTVTTTPVSGPSNGTLVLNEDGTFDYTPNAGFEGIDTFEYEVCDDSGACSTATVTIDVVPDPTPGENDPPVAGDDSAIVEQNTPVTGDLLGNDTDPNGDPLTINTTPVIPPSSGTLVINPNGTYEYTPNPGFTGTDTFTYEVCDSSGACDTATVTIEVVETTDPNASPVANDETTLTFVNQPVTGDLLSNDGDPDGDPITINTTPLAGPNNGTITINPDGTYEYRPNAGFTGTDTVLYEVCDDNGACDTAVLTIEVQVDPTGPANDPPFAANDAGIGTVNQPIEGNVLANDTDPNGDPITVDVDSIVGPEHGSLVINEDGSYTYTPDPDFVGVDSFTYDVCDDSGACGTATVQLTVYNQLPQANDDFVRTPIGEEVSIPVLANDVDPDGDPLTVIILDVDHGGTATVDPNGNIVFTPDNDFLGTTTIKYLVEDPNGGTSTATVTIEVFLPYTWDSHHKFDEDFDASFEQDAGSRPFNQPLLTKQIFTLAPEPIFSGYARPGAQVIGRIYDQSGRLMGEGFAMSDPGGNWMMQFQGIAKFEHYRIEFDYVVQSADIFGYLGLNPSDNSYQAMQPLTGWEEPMSVHGALNGSPQNALARMHQENNRPQGLGT